MKILATVAYAAAFFIISGFFFYSLVIYFDRPIMYVDAATKECKSIEVKPGTKQLTCKTVGKALVEIVYK